MIRKILPILFVLLLTVQPVAFAQIGTPDNRQAETNDLEDNKTIEKANNLDVSTSIDRRNIILSPSNDTDLIPGATYTFATTTTSELEQPDIILSISGVESAEIENARASDYNVIKQDDKSATLSSDQNFYADNIITFDVKIPENTSANQVTVSINVEADDDKHSMSNTYDLLSRDEVSAKSILAEQARSRGQIAEQYVKMIENVNNTSTNNEKEIIPAMTDGVVTIGIESAKGYTIGRFGGKAVARTEEIRGYTTNGGLFGELEPILEALIPDAYESQTVRQSFWLYYTKESLEWQADKYYSEAEAWENGEFDRAREIISQEKSNLCVPPRSGWRGLNNRCIFFQARDQADYVSNTEAEPIFRSVQRFAVRDSNYIEEVLEPQAHPPSPTLSVENRRSLSDELNKMDAGESTTVEVRVSNGESAGRASSGYLSVSYSDNLDIEEVNKASGDDEGIETYQSTIGDLIRTKNGKKEAKFPLLDIVESYSPNESNTYNLSVKKSSNGSGFLAFRTAMRPTYHTNTQSEFKRAPTSGPVDQQGWYVTKITYGAEEGGQLIAEFVSEQSTVSTGDLLQFNASNSKSIEWTIEKYKWDFDGDGKVDEVTSSPEISHAYEKEGTYQITLIVVDRYGNEAETSQMITVESDSLVGEFDCKAIKYGGSGTDSDPYQITNVQQLQCIGSQGLEADYQLTSDINASATAIWNENSGFEPIGTDGTSFEGTFDGSGYNISGLTIDRKSNGVGLFSRISGTVKDVNVTNVSISGNSNVGGIVGVNNGTIERTSVTGSVIGGNTANQVGGVAGTNLGTIVRSRSTIAISGGLDDHVGGLVGKNTGDIKQSYAIGDISGADFYVGGLVGVNENGGKIIRSYARVDVDGNDHIGGLVGTNSNTGSIAQTYATGSVTARAIYETTGGLVASNSGTVIDSYWDRKATKEKSSGGLSDKSGLLTDQMQGESAPENMSNFDFKETWAVVSDPADYPKLQWIEDSSSGDEESFDGKIETDDVFNAIENWRAGEIDSELVFDVIYAWRNGETVT